MSAPLDACPTDLTRCAGCHDQCLSATAEAVVSGNQTRVVSRVATIGLRLLDGRLAWSDDTAAALFHGLNDGSQAEVCIFGSAGHRIEPYVRALRAEAVRRGYAPIHVRAAMDRIEATGDAFGVQVPVSDPSDVGGWLVLHDAATFALDPAAASATGALVQRAATQPAQGWVPSVGAIEEDLGLPDAALRATATLLDLVARARPSHVVSSDPVVVSRARAALATLYPDIEVMHIAQLLARSDVRFAVRAGSVAIHDPGAMSRSLGAATAVRSTLGRVPGIRVLEPVETGRRATSDGPLGPYIDDDAARAMASRRLAELRATGADMIVTTSPYSLDNLRRVAGGLPVADLAVLLDDIGAPA